MIVKLTLESVTKGMQKQIENLGKLQEQDQLRIQKEQEIIDKRQAEVIRLTESNKMASIYAHNLTKLFTTKLGDDA